jgi:hypothetical protein
MPCRVIPHDLPFETGHTRDPLNTIDAIAKAGAGFRSLRDAWADTTTARELILAGSMPAKRHARLSGPSTLLIRRSEGWKSLKTGYDRTRAGLLRFGAGAL